MKRFILITATAILGLVLLVPGASLYYESGGGRGCTSCHEMQTMYDDWHSSSHRGIACQKCHGGALTLDPAFHWNNAMRLVAHVRGDLPERIGFANRDVQAMTDRCRSCHRQEYAAWHAGPHSASYARIFLDKQHNTANKLMDDCLRCHGMHFGRGIAELVTPISHTGPWRLQREDLSNLPSMPCLTCHEIHRTGPVLTKVGVKGSVPGPMQEVMPSSLAFFRPPHPTVHSRGGPAVARHAGRHSCCEDEPGPAAGPLLSVSRAGLHKAGGKRRRPHRHWSARRHQLSGMPFAARPDHQSLVRDMPSEDVELRARRGEDGHHVPVGGQQAQHPLGQVHGLPWSSCSEKKSFG